jgi:heme exporter protein B
MSWSSTEGALRGGWSREIGAVFRKEARSEARSRSGLLTAGLFGVVSVVAIAFAAVGQRLSPGLAGGLIWATLLFVSVLSIPRVFFLEEEQGSGDLLRLYARPHSVFWGKGLFALAQLWIAGALVGGLFLVLTGTPLPSPGLFALGLAGGCAALAGTVTFAGALAAQAANRALLAGSVSLVLLLPLIALGVLATRAALTPEGARGGAEAILGLWSYAAATWALCPHVFAAIWKR